MKKIYDTFKKIAEETGFEYIEVFRQSAAIVADDLKKDPESWRRYQPGMFVNLDGCGLKMDGANNIAGAIEEMNDSDQPQDWRDGKSGISQHLAMIENIIDVEDEDLWLFPYSSEVPEGCSQGGSRCEDEEAATRAREAMNKQYMTPAEREAARRKYAGYWFTVVTMFRSPNYCVFIDAEGYNYCRYLLFLPTWRTMYADELKAARDAEQQRKDEAEADKVLEEAKAMLKYKADCDQIRPFMVVDLSSFELEDRRGRQSGRRRNIMAVLRHYFPGVKFSVKYRWASHTELEVEWTDGPTCKEVESVCNWSVFCDTWESFDGMTDSTSRGSRKYTEFAQQYGGGFLDGISFDRGNSRETLEECREYARSIFESCGLDSSKDYHESSPEGMKIYNACPYLNGSGYYWYSVNSLAVIVAAKLSHFAA